MIDVTVLDYGVGNLLSVSRALEQCGARVAITSEATAILAANRVVLPGVGAFSDGMAALRTFGMDDVLRRVAAKGTPLLGICLGMQMLSDESEEFGVHSGLGLIPGRVVKIPASAVTGVPLKIPHIGWNELLMPIYRNSWQGSLLATVETGQAVYFVHSFMAEPISPAHRLADCLYGGNVISAVIENDNVMGCQFHPEKSGEVGLQILKNFLQR